MRALAHSLLAAFAAGCANGAFCDEKRRKDYLELNEQIPDFASAQSGLRTSSVIAGLDQAIHVFPAGQGVDARDKPAHDGDRNERN